MTLMEGLGIAGGLVLAAVVAHGAWTTRRASPRRPDGATGERVDPVLGQGGAVPAAHGAGAGASLATGAGLGAAAGVTLDGPALHGGPAGPLSDVPGGAAVPPLQADPGEPMPELRPLQPRKMARLDHLIDAIAALTLEAPVSGELALTHLPPSRRAGTKPFMIEGLNAESNAWELPAPGQRYAAFQAGVQLANRSGALNEIEYSEFVQKLQAFADSVGAMVELPDMMKMVGLGRELDQFASGHDAQLAIHLRANSAAWTVGYLQQTAGRHGFVPGVLPGRLVMPSADAGAPPILVLSFDANAALADDPNVSAVRQVQLALDVPQTPESAEPFPAWHESARRLAAEIDATMIDDQGYPITLHAFAAIGEDLNKLYRTLEARDLAAGSAAARRLFS